MIKNNKGAVIIITVVSMFILTIIVFVCIEMFIAQNMLVAADVAKIRTFYAADGVAEMLRGQINKVCPDSTTNYLDSTIPPLGSGTLWSGATVINNAIAAGYDTTPTFPVVCARVEIRRVNSPPSSYVDFSTTTAVQYYRIMGVSSVTVNSNVIYSTASYYFYVAPITIGTTTFYRKRFAGWREHKTIQNDTGLIQ
ncbi:MAG: hypothetical protein PHT24_06915 [Endomicrobiaceae bacterium]|nr:hypothetical protein [Endomicrobiaceae bacterium]